MESYYVRVGTVPRTLTLWQVCGEQSRMGSVEEGDVFA